MRISVSGTPVVGDDYQIQPATTDNMFNTITNLITALDVGDVGDAQKSSMQMAVQRGMSELDLALENVTEVRTDLGARLNAIDSARELNDNFILHSKSVLSSLQDLDLAKAITELSFQSVALQAAQQSYLRVQNLSLFNYI